jgi:hypothetical protein
MAKIVFLCRSDGEANMIISRKIHNFQVSFGLQLSLELINI